MTRKKLLTAADLDAIRKLLPYDWRLQITKANPDMTTRQVTEAFYLRTRNADWAAAVFTPIAATMKAQGQLDLARKCRARIRVCRSIQLAAVA